MLLLVLTALLSLAPQSPAPTPGDKALARVHSLDLLGIDDDLADALGTDPDDLSALRAKAELLELRKDVPGAITVREHLLELHEDPADRRKLATLLSEVARLEDALALLEAPGDPAFADLTDPLEHDDWLGRAAQLDVLLGRWDVARARVAERLAISRSPRMVAAAAAAHEASGLREEALRLYERAAELASDDDELAGVARTLHIGALLRGGRRAEAYDALRDLWSRPFELPFRYPLADLIRAMDRAANAGTEITAPDPTFHVRRDLPPITVSGDDNCLPDALRAMLDGLGIADDPARARALDAMRGTVFSAVATLKTLGVELVPFRVEEDQLVDLLRADRLVLVTMTVVLEDCIAGHAALAIGFDSRLGIILVDDNGGLRARGFVPVADLVGQPALVAADGDADELRERLAGAECWEQILVAEDRIEQRRVIRALAASPRAVKLDPEEPFAHLTLARAFYLSGVEEQGLASLRTALRLDRADAAQAVILLEAARQADDLPTQRAAAERLLEFAPDSLPARSAWACVLCEENVHPEPILRAAERALAIDELDLEGLYARGYARLWNDDYAGAIADLELRLGLDPDSDAWWHLGSARASSGDAEGATEAFAEYRERAEGWGYDENELLVIEGRIKVALRECAAEAARAKR